MHLAKHAWILSITVNTNDNYCQKKDAGLNRTTLTNKKTTLKGWLCIWWRRRAALGRPALRGTCTSLCIGISPGGFGEYLLAGLTICFYGKYCFFKSVFFCQ